MLHDCWTLDDYQHSTQRRRRRKLSCSRHINITAAYNKDYRERAVIQSSADVIAVL